jgi:hypothetical protein
MASITTWVRIEPRSRDPQLLAGTEARLHDPLWLVARQWQFGELTAADVGSAITARTRTEIARLDAVRTDDGTWHPFDGDRTPLDAALAPAATERTAAPPLERRARTGRQLSRMLAATPSAGTVILSRFPLRVTYAELATLDEADRRFFAVMTDRVPDGDAAAAALAPLLAAGDLTADFGITQVELAAASSACREWLAWRASIVRTSKKPAWQPDRIAYRLDARARMTGLDVRLAVRDHERSTVQWHDVDAFEGEPNRVTSKLDVSTSIPTHVRFRGAPARRYWDLEDSAVNWSAIAAGPGDVARLVTIELALAFADHWLQVPLALPAGSISRVVSLVVTDTFGTRTLVRSAAELDGHDRTWRFCELTHTAKVPAPLVFVPPAAGTQLAGRTLQAIELARDDVHDVLWAIDRTLRGADGRPRSVELTPPTSPSPESPTYHLGVDVPSWRHPYRARVGATGLELVRATVPGALAAPARPDLPLRISVAAAPTSPAQVRTFYTLARTSDGGHHLVLRHALAPVAPSPGFALEFDRVVGDQA